VKIFQLAQFVYFCAKSGKKVPPLKQNQLPLNDMSDWTKKLQLSQKQFFFVFSVFKFEARFKKSGNSKGVSRSYFVF